jgi:hypothetical protein
MGKPEEKNHLEYPGLDGRIILRWIFRILDWGGGGMDWIDLIMDRDRWRALVPFLIESAIAVQCIP